MKGHDITACMGFVFGTFQNVGPGTCYWRSVDIYVKGCSPAEPRNVNVLKQHFSFMAFDATVIFAYKIGPWHDMRRANTTELLLILYVCFVSLRSIRHVSLIFFLFESIFIH